MLIWFECEHKGMTFVNSTIRNETNTILPAERFLPQLSAEGKYRAIIHPDVTAHEEGDADSSLKREAYASEPKFHL
jgi:hypothetical protein